MELEQVVALYQPSTRHGKAGAEKVERSLSNADPATIKGKQKEKLFHISFMSVLIYTASLVLKDLIGIWSLTCTDLSHYNEKESFGRVKDTKWNTH